MENQTVRASPGESARPVHHAGQPMTYTRRLGAGADSFGTGVVSVNNIVPVPQQVKEVTITGEYKVLEGLMFRAEYRHDWSNRAFFERGQPACVGFTVTTCPADFGLGNSKKQDTVALAFIAFFGPKR